MPTPRGDINAVDGKFTCEGSVLTRGILQYELRSFARDILEPAIFQLGSEVRSLVATLEGGHIVKGAGSKLAQDGWRARWEDAGDVNAPGHRPVS